MGDRVEFERIDPAAHARRFYAMTVAEDGQLDLFAKAPWRAVLVVAWGRLGARPRVLRKRYMAPDELAAEWERLRALRAKHGYVVTKEA